MEDPSLPVARAGMEISPTPMEELMNHLSSSKHRAIAFEGNSGRTTPSHYEIGESSATHFFNLLPSIARAHLRGRTCHFLDDDPRLAALNTAGYFAKEWLGTPEYIHKQFSALIQILPESHSHPDASHMDKMLDAFAAYGEIIARDRTKTSRDEIESANCVLRSLAYYERARSLKVTALCVGGAHGEDLEALDYCNHVPLPSSEKLIPLYPKNPIDDVEYRMGSFSNLFPLMRQLWVAAGFEGEQLDAHKLRIDSYIRRNPAS